VSRLLDPYYDDKPDELRSQIMMPRFFREMEKGGRMGQGTG
jgi:hypothetical protein